MLARHFRELDVYKAALDLATEVHRFGSKLPPEERFALADQMRRASRSVCANIAEAWRKRRYNGAFIARLSEAETEAAEMQAWLDVAQRLGYLNDAEHKKFDTASTKKFFPNWSA